MLGLNDLACFDALDTDVDSFDSSLKEDLDILKVREKTTMGLTRDLAAGPAFGLGHTAPFILAAGKSPFSTYFANIWHEQTLSLNNKVRVYLK